MKLQRGNPLPWYRRQRYRAVWKLQRQAGRRVQIERDRGAGSAVYIIGSSRSGTTWLSDCVNYRNRYRYIFEPLTAGKVPELAAFRHRQYLRPGDTDPRYLEPMRRLIAGSLHHEEIDKFNRCPVARRRLIKDVQANLLAGWLRAQFPDVAVIFLMRHPMAVLTSRLANSVNAAAGFQPELTAFLEQDALVADWLEPHVAAIRSSRSMLEQQAYWWCIENHIPRVQLADDAVHMVFYETLLTEPAAEMARLGVHLGEPFDERIHARMQRFSLTTGPFSPLHAGRSPIHDWRRHWSRDEVREVLRILERFGLDDIYNDNPLPAPAVRERWGGVAVS